MENIKNVFKFNRLSLVILSFFLIMSPIGAYAACCAGHGGVASCNKATGYKMCKDKSASPTCTCAKSKSSAIKTKTKATTPAKSSWFGAKSTKTTGSTNSRGCCSRHGGIAQCNTLKGHLNCKDGTLSPSCSCH